MQIHGLVILFLNNHFPCLPWVQWCQYTIRGQGAERRLSPWQTHVAQEVSRASSQLLLLGLSAQASHEPTPPLSHPAIIPPPATTARVTPVPQATSAEGVYHQADFILAGFWGTAREKRTRLALEFIPRGSPTFSQLVLQWENHAHFTFLLFVGLFGWWFFFF